MLPLHGQASHSDRKGSQCRTTAWVPINGSAIEHVPNRKTEKTHLRIVQVIQSLLVRGIRFLQVVHHQVAVAQAAPSLPVGRVQLQDVLKVLNCLGELFLGTEDAGDRVHGLDRPLIVTQRLFVGVHRAIQVAHQFSQVTCKEQSQ